MLDIALERAAFGAGFSLGRSGGAQLRGATLVRVPDRIGWRLVLGGENEGSRAAALARGDFGHRAARRNRAILGQQGTPIIVAREIHRDA